MFCFEIWKHKQPEIMSEQKQNWGSALHELSIIENQKTKSEANAERKKLLQIIDEQNNQLEVALAIQDGKSGKAFSMPSLKSNMGEAVAFAIASDWHVEETVDAKTVNNLNEFNLGIAEKRIELFFKRVVKMTEIQRQGTKVETLVLGLLGDLMTGYIHEELRESNGLSPTETVLWLSDRVGSGLKLLEKNFGRIIIPCCYGNHGRTTFKSRHGTGAKNSYEWMLYHIIKKQFPQHEWQISDGYHNYLEVDGRVIRFHHGDDLKYQGGVGGLTIPVEKAIAQWNKAIPANLDIFGHWHQSQQNPKWISNASLIGHNAYAIAIKAGMEPPTQTFFLMDKKRGRTITAPIFLD
jgi:hypothetical protein